ncbi:hypothetical protein JOL62DRAFT_614137 [Phyllosticta paracitricarpa]|uniref:Uncharacterized protein n=1 Tax=Phyllosticta paracitricarpa TaxID=2016321 RepID=A0ABR1N0X9_9PEZI
MCQLKARKDAKKLFKKPFFAAQLKYHDIKFKSSRKVDDLRNLLEESIRQEPDRTKTPEVLGLQGFYDKRELIARVVPGLHTAPCRLHIEFVENHDLCVGWDEAAVVRKAQDINREVEEERKREEDTKKKELDAQWQKEVQPYRQYMYRRPAMKIAPPPSFEQRHCVGSYIVRCDEITKKEECALRMTICPGVEGSLIADYNSGIIEGTMLLDASRKRLDELVVRLDEKQRRCRLQGAVW